MTIHLSRSNPYNFIIPENTTHAINNNRFHSLKEMIRQPKRFLFSIGVEKSENHLRMR